jgi:hypothetical protein
MKGMKGIACAVVFVLALAPAAFAQDALKTPVSGIDSRAGATALANLIAPTGQAVTPLKPMFTSETTDEIFCTGYDERVVIWYTDNTYTTQCGRRIESCDGYVAQWGCQTYFHIEQSCDCNWE